MFKNKSVIPNRDSLKKAGLSRRDFLRNMGLTGLGLGAAAAMAKISLPTKTAEASQILSEQPQVGSVAHG